MLAALVMGDRNENERADRDVLWATAMVNLMGSSGLRSTLFAWLVSVGSRLVATLSDAEISARALHLLPAAPGPWGAHAGGFKLIAAVHFSRFFFHN